VDGASNMRGVMRNALKISAREPERMRPFGRIRVHGRVILKWALNK